MKFYELADRITNISKVLRKIERKMDRSKRSTNPENFNPDGTVKKSGSKKMKWRFSKRYHKLALFRRELFRKQADTRKYQHECMANEIIEMGDKFYIETMNFKALQKRAKETAKDKRGKYRNKKRYGKSIGNKAPAMLIAIINRKLKRYGTSITEIDTQKARASQYNHLSKNYHKKKLSERWNDFGNGLKVQRDLYSAFLIMNTNETCDGFEQSKCEERFETFLKMHDKEIERLRQFKQFHILPNCMGI